MGILCDATPAEIDPSSDGRQAGLSLLLGRVPGAHVHTFAAARPEGAYAPPATASTAQHTGDPYI